MTKLGPIFGFASLLIFLTITALVFSNATQTPDAQLALVINGSNLGSMFAGIMILFAKYGREHFWIPLVGLMFIFGNRSTKLLALELAAVVIAAVVVGEGMKFLLHRPRPFETVSAIVRRIPTHMDSSYPSGHALIASIGAAFALVKFKNRIVALLLTFEAALVCCSRIYVGMHYPLDVVAGIFLALGIVGVGLLILERYLNSLLPNSLASLALKIFKNGPLKL